MISAPLNASEAQPGKVMGLLQELIADGRNRVDQRQEPWIIVEVPSKRTLYYFMGRTDDPSFPSVYIRRPIERNGIVSIETRVICETTKAACDQRLEQFLEMDQQIKRKIQEES